MKIAVMLPNWLGDTCMATPALRAISQHPSLQSMLVVGRRAPLQILEGLSFVSQSVEYKPLSKSPAVPGRRSLTRQLRKRKLDAIILFPNSLSSALIAFLSGAKRRIGYDRNGRALLLTDRIPIVSTPMGSSKRTIVWKEQPLIDYYLNIASHFDCPSTDNKMAIGTSTEDFPLAQQLMAGLGLDIHREYVVINNGSAASVSRLWPEEYYSIVASELAQRGIQVVVHAGPSDRLQANAIAAKAVHPLVQSMGRFDHLPLALSRGLLSSAEVVVTTDSGVRHMASALNRPVIVLYGPTSTVLTRTYNGQETAISAGLPCQPCVQPVCPLKHNRCMSDIKPDRVVHAVLKRLKDVHSAAA